MKRLITLMAIMAAISCASAAFGAETADTVPEISLPAGESALENGRFNAPGSKLFGWRLRTSNLGKFMMTDPQEGSRDPVLTMTVTSAHPKPWMMELHQGVRKTVEKGCTMYITFEYKMTEGYSFQFYWQVERSPWPKLLSLRLTGPANEWHRIRVAAPVHETYAPEMTSFSFHLAEAPGVLQLRGMYAVLVPNDFNPDTLETNETAVLGGDFYDREWREKVTEAMLKTRKAPLEIRVSRLRPGAAAGSKHHPAAPGAVVFMDQVSRPFETGAVIPPALLFPELLKQPGNEDLRTRLAGHEADAGAYRSLVLNHPLVRRVTCMDLVTWRQHELWGAGIEERLLKELAAAGKTLCAGMLYYPSFSSLPDARRTLDRKALSDALTDYIRETTARLAGKVPAWMVVHDAIRETDIYRAIGVDSIPQAFAAARQGDPNAKLLLSDCGALNSISEVPLQDLAELGTWLSKTAGVTPDGVVLDACLRRLDVGPQTLEKRLAALAAALPGVPFHIVNLSVNMDKEEFQSEMLSDCLLLFYSMPQIQSVSFGELWTRAASMPSLGYLKDDFTPKRAWQLLEKRLRQDWIDHAELKTDDHGAAQASLFGGEYDVKVVYQNITRTYRVRIPDGYELRSGFSDTRGDGWTLTYHPKTGAVLRLTLPAPKPAPKKPAPAKPAPKKPAPGKPAA